MIPPNLNLQEYRWLSKNRCKAHSHQYITHYPCYLKERENVVGERIGFLDIETEDLNADYGSMFCYCILDGQTGKIYFDVINKDDIKKWGRKALEDTRILKSLVRDMSNFDRVVGHYSSRFDLPFIRTRAVMANVEYPSYGVYSQTDTWRILRSKFKLSRNSLENGTRTLVGKTEKNHLSLQLKHACLRGEKWAIDYTLDHCKRDVRDTKALYDKISPYIKINQSSI